ncbi:MAG: IS1182 family transposase [Thermodesulfobacterium sp.]|nr:IS1182 family transposase [Thermodesulfobacterium sp.]RKX63364.1 MAG: IS1182 family transposase [Thermodesulfobacteriota bacterium]
MKYIQGVPRRQTILFPKAIDDYIEEENPVQFIDAFVDNLDLEGLGFKHTKLKSTGRPPYNPADLLKLYIYGYLNRIRSSRCLEKECKRNIELMWLLKKLAPDFKTIADFRKDNKQAIKRVCREFILLCKKLDLFSGELVAIDGSKFKAVNSKKRNFNQQKLKKKIKEIEEKIEDYFKDLEENDAKESNVSSPTAKELKAKIELLKNRKRKYQNLLKGLKESGETQVSLTDADARAMVNNQKIEVCYNVQMAVDEKHKMILDYEVTNEVKDTDQLSKMAKRAKEILEVEKLEILADKGYFNAKEIKECVDNKIIPYIPKPKSTVSKEVNVPKPEFYKEKFNYNANKDVYICPAGHELTYKNSVKHHGKIMRIYKTKECKDCPYKGRCTRNPKGRIIYRWEHEEILEEMDIRVKQNKNKVKMRQWLIEHVFGTIKRSFNQGYFLLKGIKKVDAETGLSVLAYNIKRVINIIGLRKLIMSVRGLKIDYRRCEIEG